MPATVNKHGLSRDIPSDVKLAVRQACGFGCVVCGASVIEYEHIDPEFHEARSHDVDSIALLCSTCHSNVTRKFWSKEKIRAARNAPHCKQTGFSWGHFDFGDQHPAIRFAGVTFRRCTIPVAVSGLPVFQIEGPEIASGPFRLSANFTDDTGRPILEIRQNEWHAIADIWDQEFSGGRILIRDKARSQCLILRAEPPHGIAIEKLHMKVRQFTLTGDADTLHVDSPIMSGSFTNCGIDGSYIGLSLG